MRPRGETQMWRRLLMLTGLMLALAAVLAAILLIFAPEYLSLMF